MTRPRPGRVLGGTALVLAALALLVAAFPWGLLRPIVARRLSASLGRPVTIAAARRTDWLSFVPEVELAGVRIPQPAWAGPGTMVEVGSARVRFPVLPLLAGHFRPRAITVSGLRLALVRRADGHANWSDGGASGGGGGTPLAGLARLVVADSRVSLNDARRHLRIVATLAADPVRGVRMAGGGTHRDRPLSLSLVGGALGGTAAGPYPLAVAIRSPLATLRARVRMDRPLDTDHFTARLAADGQDLRYLDDLLQAGLFPTRRFALTGTLRHDPDSWRIDRLAGTIGRTRATATLAVAKRDGRTRIDGTVAAATLDFDDFASAEQRARGAANERSTGPRVIPDTRIRFDKLGHLDGTIRLDARRLLSRGASPFRSLRTTATMERRKLVLQPLDVALVRGHLTGRVAVDHRAASPRLSLDLAIRGATIETLVFPKNEVRGPLRAHIRLDGRGDTLRQAIGGAAGKVGVVVTGGDVRADYATFLGGDVLGSIGKAVGGGGPDKRAAMRCLIASFAARGGTLVPDPLKLDTAIAGATGSGRITLADERIDLRLAGRAAKPGLLQSTAPVLVFGTLSAPQLDIRPPRPERPGKSGLLSRLGFFVKGIRARGDDGAPPRAVPIDCAGLTRRALG